MKIKREKMLAAAQNGFLNATDLADYLVRKGISFRAAHALVGEMVRLCVDRGERLEELSLPELRRFSPKIQKDVYAYLTPEAAIQRRRAVGGTAPANVRRRLREMGV
jgi:argininosuccinate lyase